MCGLILQTTSKNKLCTRGHWRCTTLARTVQNRAILFGGQDVKTMSTSVFQLLAPVCRPILTAHTQQALVHSRYRRSSQNLPKVRDRDAIILIHNVSTWVGLPQGVPMGHHRLMHVMAHILVVPLRTRCTSAASSHAKSLASTAHDHCNLDHRNGRQK